MPAALAAYECANPKARRAALQASRHALIAGNLKRERFQQLRLIDCYFGPLAFRSVVANPAWLTDTVQSIAGAIYQDRAFDRLPILADALEEAGCTNADVLLHCRQPGEHVRGCWVVDLVLGKQ